MKDINLVPHYVLNERKNLRNKNRFIVWGLIGAVILAGFGIWPLIQRGLLQSDVKKTEKSIHDLQSVKQDNDRLLNLINDMNKKRNIVDKIQMKEKINLNLLGKMEKQLPKGVKISNLSYNINDGTVNLTGVAANEFAIADLIYNLRSDSSFSGMFVPSLSPPASKESANRTFSIIFKYTDEGSETR